MAGRAARLVVGAVGIAFALNAPAVARAGEAETQAAHGPWAASAITAPSDENALTIGETDVAATIHHDYIARVEVRLDVVSAPAAEACAAASLTPPAKTDRMDSGAQPPERVVTLASHATFPCNGTYTFVVRACEEPCSIPAAVPDPPAQQPASKLDMRRTIAVAMAPGVVPGVGIERDGRTARVTWDEPESMPADFAGYVVERADGNGEFAEVERVEPDDRKHVDGVPSSGGTFHWRVRALRHSPGGLVPTSADAAEPVSLTFEAVRRVTGTTVPPTRGGGKVTSSRPRGSRSTTASTLDTGYGELLPYDGELAEPGELDADEAALPDGGMGINYGGAPTGLLVPAAAALVLAVWAAHFRHLSRITREVVD